ncbi:hypothetical protein BO78DRAFT_193325 [Aspergillus sclerotiicarbonarius CBS 121057]|uniref:Uncharacterized protein n=1 Tax=Aspergillus sclerotiicarbonarius (strain CBS 121057 / IBT 28362) TaxID=1448318 RepID=A0A319E0Q5_ASPSB|nr:hypothetical protein BO78DRAFT_193325 [Aspergillus sclerotiicarbonarius CBS 121057]
MTLLFSLVPCHSSIPHPLKDHRLGSILQVSREGHLSWQVPPACPTQLITSHFMRRLLCRGYGRPPLSNGQK